jgi:hypothetical protein
MNDEAIAIQGISPEPFGWEWEFGRIIDSVSTSSIPIQRLKKTLILPFILALNL